MQILFDSLKLLVPFWAQFTDNTDTVKYLFCFARKYPNFDPKIFMNSLAIESIITKFFLKESNLCVKNSLAGNIFQSKLSKINL